jgi:AAA+ ATPase superfamily predicted ATPase
MDILTAISFGKRTFSEISDFTKVRRENLTTYLSSLEMLKLISREHPVLVEKKRTYYVMTDPFFEFWFRFVRPNKSVLELGLEESLWRNIEEDFNSYLGLVFERISREHIVSKIRSGEIEIDADVIGRWEYGGEEIDLIAYSSREKRGILFEVKWKELQYSDAKNILSKLIGKSHLVKIEKKEYGLIAKKLSGKEMLKKEGFFAMDLDDMA